MPGITDPCSTAAKWLRGAGSAPMLIGLTALTLRLCGILVLGTYRTSSANDYAGFGAEMGRIASSIATGDGFSSPLHGPTGPTAMVAPMYPYVLAGVFSLFGIYSDASSVVILALNSLFSALTCVVVYAIGLHVFGPRVAVLSAWAWALCPYALYWPTTLIWETSLSTLLLSLAVLLAIRLRDEPRLRAWLAFGVVWGLLALTNTALVLALPFSLAWLVWQAGPRLAARRWLPAVALFAFVVTVLPWNVRNYATFGAPILIRQSGQEIYLGNADGATGWRLFTLQPENNPDEMQAFRMLGERTYIERVQHAAVEWITADPPRFVRLTAARVIYYWAGPWTTNDLSHLGGAVNFAVFSVGFAVLSLMAFLGLGLAMRQSRSWLPLLLLIPLASVPLAYYVTYTQPRYRHPLEPIMVLLAVYLLSSLWQWCRGLLNRFPTAHQRPQALM